MKKTEDKAGDSSKKSAKSAKTSNLSLSTDAKLHLTKPKPEDSETPDITVKKRVRGRPDISESTIKFGSAIKAFRSKMGISQAALAEILQVSRNTVVKWETDSFKPEPDMAVVLCKTLGMSLDELYGVSTNSVSAQEMQMLREYRRISQVGQRVIEKMINNMLDEELKAKDELFKASFTLFEEPFTRAAAGSGTPYSDQEMTYCFMPHLL